MTDESQFSQDSEYTTLASTHYFDILYAIHQAIGQRKMLPKPICNIISITRKWVSPVFYTISV